MSKKRSSKEVLVEVVRNLYTTIVKTLLDNGYTHHRILHVENPLAVTVFCFVRREVLIFENVDIFDKMNKYH